MEEPSETTSSTHASNLEAFWVVGFVDGEGCFYVGINPHREMTTGFQVLPEFTVVQHERDVQLLHKMKEFFGCGVVRSNHGDRLAYRVRDLKHLSQIIVPFFERHRLKSKKYIDFLKFRRVIMLMQRGDHLKKEGLEEIKQIASVMNRGGEDRVQLAGDRQDDN